MLPNNLARLKENLEIEKRRIKNRLNRTSIDSHNHDLDIIGYRKDSFANSLQQISFNDKQQ